jgi:hypothetical protein
MSAYEHCSLGPHAPTAEQRRAEQRRQKALTMERLAKSGVKLPRKWSKSAIDRMGGQQEEKVTAVRERLRVREEREQRAVAVEVRQFARRLNGEPPEDSVIEEEPRPGYYSASRATRCVKCRWDPHRCLDCSGDLRARLELQDKLNDGYQEPARGDPGEWCRVLQPAKIRGGFAASSKAVGLAKVGQVIETIESRLNSDGVRRVRFCDGWVSASSSDGTTLLLERVDGDDAAAAAEAKAAAEAAAAEAAARAAAAAAAKAAAEAAAAEAAAAKAAAKAVAKAAKAAAKAAAAAEEDTETEDEDDETEDSEYETETETETTRKSGGGRGSTLPQFTVKQQAVVRTGFEMASTPAGGRPLRVGSVVQALETKVNARGVLRVRLEQGWVSETAGDGTVLLQRVVDDDETEEETDDGDTDAGETEDDETEGETEDDESSAYETETETTQQPAAPAAPAANDEDEAGHSLPQFTVKQQAVVRTGFEMTSTPAGGRPLGIGSVVQALETKVNARGVLRVRLEQGWVSETAGDGTVLLQRVVDDDETDTEDNESSAYESSEYESSEYETETETSESNAV